MTIITDSWRAPQGWTCRGGRLDHFATNQMVSFSKVVGMHSISLQAKKLEGLPRTVESFKICCQKSLTSRSGVLLLACLFFFVNTSMLNKILKLTSHSPRIYPCTLVARTIVPTSLSHPRRRSRPGRIAPGEEAHAWSFVLPKRTIILYTNNFD